MRIEVDERAFLLEIEVLRKPIERTCMAVLYIDWYGGRRREPGARQRHRQEKRDPVNRHRAD